MVDPILIDSTALKLFLKKYKNKIQLEEKNKIREFYSALSEKRKINKEFNLQWEIYGNENKLYGMDKNSFKSRLFKELPKKPFEDKFFKDKIIVEGGSGHGLFAEILSPLCRDYIGVDLNVNLSRLKGKNFNNVSFVQANLLKLPLVDNFSDFTFSHGVIHHTPNPKKAFSNLAKTLKKNRCFYLWVYPKESLIFEF
jgi:SAM-dependent methyltransferase